MRKIQATDILKSLTFWKFSVKLTGAVQWFKASLADGSNELVYYALL